MWKKAETDYSLYLLTDRGILGGRDLPGCIAEAVSGGVTAVQLREKNISSLEFYELAKDVKRVTDDCGVPLIINDRLDIALAVDATGLHVGQRDLPAAIARRLLGPKKILGVSAATLKEALQAQKDGADYLGVGAIYPTSTKSDVRRVELADLHRIKEQVRIPVVAIGGINEGNIKEVMAEGIDGTAIVSGILAQADISKAARRLFNLIRY